MALDCFESAEISPNNDDLTSLPLTLEMVAMRTLPLGNPLSNSRLADNKKAPKTKMAAVVGGFRSADTPHGYAKREMLKTYLTSFLCQNLELAIRWEGVPEGHWAICYIDAFAWRGQYEVPALGLGLARAEQENGTMGSPIVALSTALRELKKYRTKYRETVGVFTDQNGFKAIHFVFNDLELQNIVNLKNLVQNQFQRFDFQLVSDTVDSDRRNVLFYQDSETGSADIEPWYAQVTLVVGRFEDLEIPTDSKKTFSFIDPCGIAHIPLSTVERFIGPNKEVFINLMVMTINRVANNPRAQSCIQKLFGQSAERALTILNVAQNPENSLKEKYQSFVIEYEEMLKDISDSSGSKAVHFLFAKGKRNSEVGNQFYMVFFTTDPALKPIKHMKDAMQKFTQKEEGEPRFTDFYSLNGIQIPFGRKTTNVEEAREILKHFRGQTVPLYEVQRWILVDSPFTFHSRALKHLEDQGIISVSDEAVNILGRRRIRNRRGNFLATSAELGKADTKLWKLSFKNTILA